MSIYLFHCNSMLYSIVQLIWEQGLIFRCWIKTSAGSVFSSLNLSSRASSFYIFDLSYAWLILKVNGLFIRVQFMNEREIERQVDIITTYTHFVWSIFSCFPSSPTNKGQHPTAVPVPAPRSRLYLTAGRPCVARSSATKSSPLIVG